MCITVGDFLEKLNEIAAEGPRYRLGGYGKDGTCDCIGLTIGAIRRCGGIWGGIHGSNYAARYELVDLNRTTKETLEVGRQVLKVREKGNVKWKLPSRYAGSADQRDYYHAGVVTSVNPLIIIHSTGTGLPNSIKHDAEIGDWLYGGRLKKVDYSDTSVEIPTDDMSPSKTATVATQNRGAVKLRAKPTKACGLYWAVPCGATVTVIETDTGSAGWWQVRYGSRVGYCMYQFLAVG